MPCVGAPAASSTHWHRDTYIVLAPGNGPRRGAAGHSEPTPGPIQRAAPRFPTYTSTGSVRVFEKPARARARLLSAIVRRTRSTIAHVAVRGFLRAQAVPRLTRAGYERPATEA